jgi:hypothetical protein
MDSRSIVLEEIIEFCSCKLKYLAALVGLGLISRL